MPTLDSLFGSPLLLSLLILAAFFVGLSKGGLPGVGMLSVPVLSLVMSPVNAAVLLLPLYILSDTVGVWLYRKHFSVYNLKVLIPAGFIGIGAGWTTASLVSDSVVSLLIGIMGVTFCLHIWFGNGSSRPARKPTLARGLLWGSLSGFTSFVSHAGAPPYQIYMLPQKLPKLVFAGTTTIVFAAINLAKFLPYSNLHPYSEEMLKVAAVLLPAALVGTIAGKELTKWLSEAEFFMAVQIALFAICLRLIYTAISS